MPILTSDDKILKEKPPLLDSHTAERKKLPQKIELMETIDSGFYSNNSVESFRDLSVDEIRSDGVEFESFFKGKANREKNSSIHEVVQKVQEETEETQEYEEVENCENQAQPKEILQLQLPRVRKPSIPYRSPTYDDETPGVIFKFHSSLSRFKSCIDLMNIPMSKVDLMKINSKKESSEMVDIAIDAQSFDGINSGTNSSNISPTSISAEAVNQVNDETSNNQLSPLFSIVRLPNSFEAYATGKHIIRTSLSYPARNRHRERRNTLDGAYELGLNPTSFDRLKTRRASAGNALMISKRFLEDDYEELENNQKRNSIEQRRNSSSELFHAIAEAKKRRRKAIEYDESGSSEEECENTLCGEVKQKKKKKNAAPKKISAKAKGGQKACDSCHSAVTPIWREVKSIWGEGWEDILLCNACGLQWRMCGLHCDKCSYVPRASEKKSKQCVRCENGIWYNMAAAKVDV